MKKICSIVLAITLIIGVLSTTASNLSVAEAAETNDAQIKLVMISDQSNDLNDPVKFKLLVESELIKKDEMYLLDYSKGLKLNLEKVIEENKGTIQIIEHNEKEHKLTFKLEPKSSLTEVRFESVVVSAGTFHLYAKSEKLTSNELVINIQEKEKSSIEQQDKEKENSVNEDKKEEQKSEDKVQNENNSSIEQQDEKKENSVNEDKKEEQKSEDKVQSEESSKVEQEKKETESLVNESEKEEQFAASRSIDDPGDLDGWEELFTNEPVEFPVKKNEANRKYYMYFGSIDTTKTEGTGTNSDLHTSIASPSKTLDAGTFQIITKTEEPGDGAAGPEQQWLSYNYQKGNITRTDYGTYGLSLMRTDELGQKGFAFTLANTKGVGLTSYTKDKVKRGGFKITRLYKRKDSPGLRAYSEVKEDGKVVGNLRVTMTPDPKEDGRVRNDIRFINNQQSQHVYTFATGVHSDLAGNHVTTKTYSLGNLTGIYVGIDGVLKEQKTPDKHPYRVYFYKDGYENEPTEFKPNETLDDTLSNMVGNIFYYWKFNPDAPGITASEDPGKGATFDSPHPVYSFKWDPKKLNPGERMDIRQDMAVTEDAEIPSPPDPLTVSLTEEVTHQDGTKAETAKSEELLHYKITMKNETKNEDVSYKYAVITQKLDDNLENAINLKLKDSDGNNIGEVNQTGRFILANATSAGPVKSSKDIVVEYDAKVKEGTSVGTIIKEQATLNGFDSNDVNIDTKSNEVQTEIINGDLVFVSAPKIVSFGDALKISSQDRTYPVQSTEDKLTVQDNRTVGQSWSMTAKLLEDLTSESDENHKLLDSLHYYHKGQDYIFKKDVSLPVYEKVSTGDEPVNISDSWDAKQEGMVLKVKAGQAYAEEYKGSIQWTLQDVPGND